MRMRKLIKILHTVSACGLIGGVGCYMLLLVIGPQGTPEAYADLRRSIAVISDYVLLPSLAVALVSGLLSMVVHQPFLDKGWVWIKAAMGILMFKGVLTIVSAKADHAAAVSQRIAEGTAPADALDSLLVLEWYTLLAVMVLSLANVVLGIWRPKIMRSAPAAEASRFGMRPAAQAVPVEPSDRAAARVAAE